MGKYVNTGWDNPRIRIIEFGRDGDEPLVRSLYGRYGCTQKCRCYRCENMPVCATRDAVHGENPDCHVIQCECFKEKPIEGMNTSSRPRIISMEKEPTQVIVGKVDAP